MNKEKFRNSLVFAATPAETKLLQAIELVPDLKNKVLFQHPLHPYFVDFYFPSKKIAIEIDGSAHKGRSEKDKNRSQYIFEKYGVKIIRFSNRHVFNDVQSVIRRILSSSGVKAIIKNRAEFYGINTLALKSVKSKRGALKEHRKRNSVAKRNTVQS